MTETKIASEFPGLGIDSYMCGHGNEYFLLNGPATSNVDQVTPVSTWASSSTNALTVSISDHTNVDFDGRYTVKHIDGKSEE